MKSRMRTGTGRDGRSCRSRVFRNPRGSATGSLHNPTPGGVAVRV
ncbi:hypothetical protein ACFFX0_03690 [Citricoccus parietis]|uniref:Uncharacterized protein n=1 Tax=Citricoccus parietis TaxID=592307 RepID=A0ABV5FUH4_9MICC